MKKDDEILLTYGEHGSNILPWLNLCEGRKCKVVFAGQKYRMPTAQAIINSITEKTRIISFVSISNLLGFEIDVAAVCKAARKINRKIIVVVDATQAIPHSRLDVKATDIDFFACSGYKMGAATGTGLLYMKCK
jgi:cysteine desulfurase/selenocysteine lyase